MSNNALGRNPLPGILCFLPGDAGWGNTVDHRRRNPLPGILCFLPNQRASKPAAAPKS